MDKRLEMESRRLKNLEIKFLKKEYLDKSDIDFKLKTNSSVFPLFTNIIRNSNKKSLDKLNERLNVLSAPDSFLLFVEQAQTNLNEIERVKPIIELKKKIKREFRIKLKEIDIFLAQEAIIKEQEIKHFQEQEKFRRSHPKNSYELISLRQEKRDMKIFNAVMGEAKHLLKTHLKNKQIELSDEDKNKLLNKFFLQSQKNRELRISKKSKLNDKNIFNVIKNSIFNFKNDFKVKKISKLKF